MEAVEDLYQHLTAQRSYLEHRVQQLRTLFKPWPPPQAEVKSSSTDNHSNNEKQAESENIKPTITTEEQEGVDLVDKLLQKAQKARTIQKKLEEPKRTRELKGPKSNVQNSRVNNEQPPHQKVTSETNKISDNEDKPTLKKHPLSGKNGVVRTDLHRAQAMSKTQTSQIKSSQDKKLSNASSVKPSSRQPGGTLHQSSGTRQTSGQGRKKPVHSTAPFQTDPRLNSAKLQTTYRASTAKTMAKSRADSAKSKINTSSKNVALSANRASPADSVKPRKGSKPEVGRVTDSNNTTESDDERANSSYEETCDKNNSGTRNNLGTKDNSGTITDKPDCDKCDDDLSKRLDSIDMKQRDGATEIQPETCEDKGFQLITDGATLTLPTVYKKHVHHNRKLREKVYAQNVTKKVNATSASQDFADRLKHTFHDDRTEECHQQGRQAQQLVQIYDSLYGLIESLALDNITDESSASVIFRARKLLEYILVKFQETEQLLHSSDFRLLSSVDCRHSSKVEEKITKPESKSVSIWYNPKWTLPGFDSVSSYRYRAFRQLETYITLVYNVQWLQLQLDLMDRTAQLILPTLQSIDPASSEYIHVLRAAYSLLSINPNKGPVVVRDTIQDSSVLETDDTNS